MPERQTFVIESLIELNKKPRVGAKHSHKKFRITLGTSKPSKVEYFIDKGDGTTLDAIELARKCKQSTFKPEGISAASVVWKRRRASPALRLELCSS